MSFSKSSFVKHTVGDRLSMSIIMSILYFNFIYCGLKCGYMAFTTKASP